MNHRNNKLPPRTYLYFTAQAISLTCGVMSVTMAALVGAALAPSPALATLPYGVQFLFLMLATYPASKLMSRIGRKRAFMLGAIALVVSGLSGYWAIGQQQFAMLIISHAALGVYIAFANFNRFAATDNLAAHLKPRAISLVVAGGVIAAVAGPTLAQLFRQVDGYPLFALCYLVFVALAILSALVAACLPADAPGGGGNKGLVDTPAVEAVLITRPLAVAIAVAALGYAIMNLLMIQSAMHMQHMHEPFSNISLAIQWHVLAMFAPSFFTGLIIHKLGVKATICAGLLMLMGSAAINLWSEVYGVMSAALIVLGLGWNLTYIGGGALLSQTLQNSPGAFQIQGKNDLVIAVCATLGAFSPALLLSAVGWAGSNIICMALSGLLLLVVGWALKSRGQENYAVAQGQK